jgi:hypothetical protein
MWGEHYKSMQHAGHEVTWAEFKQAFKDHHIPKGLMDGKMKVLTPFGVNKQEHANGAKKAESPPAPVRPVRRTGQTGVLGFAYFERSVG